LRIAPAEAMRLTVYQLNLMLEAESEEKLAKKRFQAALVAELMNMEGKTLKNRVTGDQLLGLKKATGLSASARKFRAGLKKKKRTYEDYLKEHGEA
jgi:hypothetical protein